MKEKKSWVIDILVDIVVTVVIICAVFLDYPLLIYLVIGYTILMLFIKLLVLSSEQLQAITKKGKSEAPDWIFHLLYAINVIFLAIFGWYFTAAAWVAIWGISVYQTGKILHVTGSQF